MALCFRNESAELMDRSVVESLSGEMGREREMSFTVIFSILFPTYVFFWIRILRIPTLLVQYPLSLIPLLLDVDQNRLTITLTCPHFLQPRPAGSNDPHSNDLNIYQYVCMISM